MAKLIGNQEDAETKQYKYNKAGHKKAVLIHILGKGDCPRCFEKIPSYYSDGNKIWKRL